MIQCVYDNPNTFSREWWIDGKPQAQMSAELIIQVLVPNSVHQNVWLHHHTKLPSPFERGKVHEGTLEAINDQD